MSVKTDLEAIIGTINDNDAISMWATNGAKYLINILSPDKLVEFAIDIADNGSGADITSARVIAAHKLGNPARVGNYNEYAMYDNPDSIYYAANTDPVFYIYSNRCFVKPNGGSVVVVQYPNITYNDIPNSNALLNKLYNHIILYAAIYGKISQVKDLLTSLTNITFVSPQAPAPPSYPQFTYNDVSYQNANYTEVGYSPAVSIKALIDAITATNISFNETLNYNSVYPTIDYAEVNSALNDQDIKLAEAHIAKVATQLEEYQKNLINSLNQFNKEKEVYNAKLTLAIENARLAQQRLIEETKNQLELIRINTQSELETQLRNLEKRTDVDLANKRAQLELDISNKAKQLEADVINASKQFEKQIEEYRGKLELFSRQIELYAQQLVTEAKNIETETTKIKLKIDSEIATIEVLRVQFTELIKTL